MIDYVSGSLEWSFYLQLMKCFHILYPQLIEVKNSF